MAIRYQPNNIKKMRVALFNKVMKDEIQKELDNEILTIMYDLSKNYNVNLSYPLIQLIDKQISDFHERSCEVREFSIFINGVF